MQLRLCMSVCADKYGRKADHDLVQFRDGVSHRPRHLRRPKAGRPSFAVIGHTPDIMGNGNWSVGLIVDDRASAEQKQAITTIASGQAGGPPAILTAGVGKLLGVESKSITYKKDGLRRSVSIPGMLEQACEGVPSVANPAEPLYIDNTMHPANSRLALAKATASHLHAFGLTWDDTSGNNNGHFAPFNWRSS